MCLTCAHVQLFACRSCFGHAEAPGRSTSIAVRCIHGGKPRHTGHGAIDRLAQTQVAYAEACADMPVVVLSLIEGFVFAMSGAISGTPCSYGTRVITQGLLCKTSTR